MASLYSMKPNPLMSLISVISPVPWVAKCASMSALVASKEDDGQHRVIDQKVSAGDIMVDLNNGKKTHGGGVHGQASC